MLKCISQNDTLFTTLLVLFGLAIVYGFRGYRLNLLIRKNMS